MSPSQRATGRRRAGRARRPRPAPPARRWAPAVVQRAEGGVDARVVAAQVDAGAVGRRRRRAPAASAAAAPAREHPTSPCASLGAPVAWPYPAAEAEHRPDRGQAGGGPGRRRRRRPSAPPGRSAPVASSSPELAALGRLEGAERAAQQGDHVVERVRRAATPTQPSTTASSSASWSSTVPLPARNPSTNAAPSAGGVPGVSARPSRASTARRRPAPGVVQQPGGPALHQPVHAAPVGELLEHAAAARAAGRVVDEGERRLDGAQPLDHRRAPRRRRALGGAARGRRRTRTTSSSNTDAQRGGVGARARRRSAGRRRAGRGRPSARRRRDRRRPARRARATTGATASGRSASSARSTAAAASTEPAGLA